ncbi:hypothetical protein [Rhodovulum sulfidophilum]|uniref:hypothetical protein n=1 Tax=Rhodovulum sulfidophilum TaxID=35806 RepID=UPI001F19E97E|nr:hypothetical protein [Rhodovulum sulfidophilum]MCE8441652.1 hypothetical protein [Rhodovulum sulfidophilum]
MARRAKRIYGTKGDARSEVLPLIVAFLAGTTGSILLKIVTINPFAGAVWAISVLLAYALYAYNATQLRLDAETIGDNCYYLGFLFTLTSLAVTLYFVVQTPTSQRADVIPQVISGFGVALASTIGGVFLRVLMLQFKVDMESRERQERQYLNETSRRFRAELGMSLDQIKAFSTESLQQSAEREVRMREAFDKLLSDMQGELLKSAADFGPALRESVKIQTQSSLEMVTSSAREASDVAARSIEAAMSEMTSVVTEIASHNSATADRIRQSIEALTTSTEILVTGADEIVQRVSQTQQAATQVTEAFTREVNDGTDGMTRAMKNARSRLENGARRFAEATNRAEVSLELGVERIGQSFEATAVRVSEAGGRLVSSLEATQLGTESKHKMSNGSGPSSASDVAK